jgi:hypothetical protein
MADALRATPSAEATEFRSSMPQAGGCGAERISQASSLRFMPDCPHVDCFEFNAARSGARHSVSAHF